MGIYLNSDVTANDIIINNMYSRIQTNTSQFLNVDTDDFGSILKQNSKADEKKKDEIYKSDIKDNSNDIRDKELKNLINNNNLERLMNDFSQNINRVYNSPIVNGLGNQAIKAFV